MQKLQRQVLVPAELAGARLDQAAAALLDEFSRSRLKRWIDAGRLTVNGLQSEPKARLKGGETLELSAELEAAVPIEPEAIGLDIVYEDEAVLVIDKPAGLVVHPGAGNAQGTLQNALLHRDPGLAALPRAGLVHRLDKDTSGLLVVARDPAAQQSLTTQIERRSVKRIYDALCQSVLTGGGCIEAALGRHPRDRTKMAVRQGGRSARTHYRVLERFRAHTLVRCELDTGRTHQIRVHMAHIRAPLVGDPAYGGRLKLPRRPTEELRLALQSFARQALHATRLAFEHPRSGELMTFESPRAADIEALLEVLRGDARAGGSA